MPRFMNMQPKQAPSPHPSSPTPPSLSPNAPTSYSPYPILFHSLRPPPIHSSSPRSACLAPNPPPTPVLIPGPEITGSRELLEVGNKCPGGDTRSARTSMRGSDNPQAELNAVPGRAGWNRLPFTAKSVRLQCLRCLRKCKSRKLWNEALLIHGRNIYSQVQMMELCNFKCIYITTALS